MAINLPVNPSPASAKFRYLEYGARLSAPLGGSTQNIMRLGDRLAMDVTLPPMTEEQANNWIAAHLEAKATGQTVRMRVPSPVGPTPVTMSGIANQASATVLTGDLSQIKRGQWFTYQAADGFLYLHKITRVSGSTIGVSPRLRRSFNGGVSMDYPAIEGWLDTGFEWDVGVAQIVGLSFNITESR